MPNRHTCVAILGGVMLASVWCIRAEGAQAPAGSKRIEVSANDGMFTPSVIRGTAHSNFILSIHAEDRDYPFVVPDVGITMTIKKGSTVDFEIGSFGVGKHLFSCGSECGGLIELELLPDKDVQ